MGSGESTTRKVSFGVDDEDRVRILRGVKVALASTLFTPETPKVFCGLKHFTNPSIGIVLSEDVLQRMKGVANIAPVRTPSANSSAQKDTGASGSASSSPPPPQSSQRRAQPSSPPSSPPRTPPSSPPSTPPSSPSNTSKPETKDDQKRFEKKQTILKEELAKKAQKEREAARQEMTKAMTRERQHTRQEAEKAKQLSPDEIEVMVQKLQKKDAQLTALDAFYKEQLAQLEKRNLERYEQSKDQFHQAASKTEEHVRPRNTDPVCLGLQTQILSCYKDNRDQTLKCSDLAKTYMQCINAAKKNLQVNHG